MYIVPTDIEGFRGLLSEQVKDLLCVGGSVWGSQVFIPTAEFSTDVIQCDSLITVALVTNRYDNKKQLITDYTFDKIRIFN